MNTALKDMQAGFAARGTFKRLESEARSYCRNVPAVFASASGSTMRDRDGREYLDFLAGAGSLNYGHNHPVLKSALITYVEADGITHSLDLHTGAKQRFLELFNSSVLAPRGLDYVTQFTGPTGANAVEAALKLARKVTQRESVIAFTNGFHGVTLGALAATGANHHRDAAGISMNGVLRAPYDEYLGDDIDTLDYLGKALADSSSGFGHPAAVLVETVQGEGGLHVASMEWLKRLESICRTHDMLLIVDDIQAGCGRTGTFFSFEPAGISPDIVTLSKSLSGYGIPLATVLIRRDLDEWQPGEHNGTFRGNNHAFVTAAAALEHFWLAESPLPLTVKGRGLMIGLGCDGGQTAAAACRRAYERGLVIETSGPDDEVIKCMPALTIDNQDLSRGLGILRDSLREVARS